MLGVCQKLSKIVGIDSIFFELAFFFGGLANFYLSVSIYLIFAFIFYLTD